MGMYGFIVGLYWILLYEIEEFVSSFQIVGLAWKEIFDSFSET